MMNLLPLIFALVAVAWVDAADVVQIDIPSMYVNHHTEVLYKYHDCGIYTISTCGFYSNKTQQDINVKLFHPNNPSNDPISGITSFVVSTSPVSTCEQAMSNKLCEITTGDSPYTPECTGLIPAGTQNIYVRVQGNIHANINYAISATIAKHTPLPEVKVTRPVAPRSVEMDTMGLLAPPGDVYLEDMTPVINYDRQIQLGYHQTALIHLQFCPNDAMKQFNLKTIFLADDPNGESLISQAVCDKLPCKITDPANQIGLNYNNLPVNPLVTGPPGAYKDLYVVAMAYGGPLDSNNMPQGLFRFGATVEKV